MFSWAFENSLKLYWNMYSENSAKKFTLILLQKVEILKQRIFSYTEIVTQILFGIENHQIKSLCIHISSHVS